MLMPRVAGMAIVAIALLLLAPLPAAAQLKVVDEVKLGALAHDVGFLGHHLEKGIDVNLEMLFTPPDILSVIGSPLSQWAWNGQARTTRVKTSGSVRSCSPRSYALQNRYFSQAW